MFRTICIMASLALSGCSMGIQNAKYAGDSAELNDSNSGIIVGSALGAGITFRNVTTNEEIAYHGASAYCIRLPIGIYALSSIGTVYGSVHSKSPFTFKVIAGQRNYIGTVVNQWQVKARKYDADREKNHAVRGYGMALSFGDYEFSVFNRLDEIGDRYKKDCPNISPSEISVLLMK